ncbi:MAG: DNA helicase UvrD, partial [Candidatus Pacearchaeota archaeon]
LIKEFDNEFNILLNVKKEKLISFLQKNEDIAELIILNREKKLTVKPGYDGIYGEIILRDKQSKLNL